MSTALALVVGVFALIVGLAFFLSRAIKKAEKVEGDAAKEALNDAQSRATKLSRPLAIGRERLARLRARLSSER